MASIRSTGTKPEREVFSYLRRKGIYFQKHYRRAHGRPDIALPRKKIAVFVDGDFWHGWKFKDWGHKLPQVYWKEKIEGNMRRDKRNFRKLRKEGWRVLRVWEHQLAGANKETTLLKVERFLRND